MNYLQRVLLISHIYPPAIDGGSKIIAKIGEYLDCHQFQTLTLTSNCFSTDDFVRSNIPTLPSSPSIIRLPVYKHLHRLLKLFGLKGPIFKIQPFLSALYQIIKFRPQIVIAGPMPTSIILYAYFISKFIIRDSKLVIIPCFHPNDPDFIKAPLSFVLKQADLLCTLTNYENKLLSQYSKNTFTLNAGVDNDFIIPLKDIRYPPQPHLLFLGNFAAHKGLNLLLDSFIHLKKSYPHLHLTIAGQKTLYHQHLPTSNPDITVIDSGYNTTKIKKLIDNCTLLILPSLHESFGLVLIEAMARGKPVVVSNLPSTTQLIKLTSGGKTFKVNDPNDFIKVVISLLSDPLKLKKMGLSGLSYVQKHLTWDRIGDKLCQKLLLL